MKILFANKYYYIKGGCERYLYDLSLLLQKKGHSCIPFSMKSSKNIRTPYEQYFVKNIDFNDLITNKKIFGALHAISRVIYSTQAKSNIIKLIRKTKPDIFHGRNIYHQLSPSILDGAKHFHIPVVITLADYKLVCPAYLLRNFNGICNKCIDGSYFNCTLNKCIKQSIPASLVASIEAYVHSFLRIYRRNVDIFVSPSNFMKNQMIKKGYKKNRIKVIPHFIDTEIIENKVNAERKHLLYVGGIEQHKGVKTLVSAMKKFPHIILYLIGEGADKIFLEKYAADNSINNVTFLGRKKRDVIFKYLSESLCLIVPSEWYEVFGIVILESFACGRPVIASRTGGIVDIISDGKTGLLFEPGNQEDLEEKLETIISNKNLPKSMGIEARKYVKKHHSPERHYDLLMSAYKIAIENCK